MLSFLKRKPEYHPIQLFDSFAVKVVGTSFRQDSIESLKAKSGFARLVCDNKNKYDKNAVKVMVGRKWIGYLCREDAIQHRCYMTRLNRHEHTLIVRYKVIGSNQMWGVRLNYDHLSF